MKRSYHVALLQKYKDGSKRGYCDHIEGYFTAYIDNWANGQAANKRKAIRLSKQVGELFVDGTDFSERDGLDGGLAAACLMSYTSEKGVLQSVEFEVYKNGELAETFKKEYKRAINV